MLVHLENGKGSWLIILRALYGRKRLIWACSCFGQNFDSFAIRHGFRGQSEGFLSHSNTYRHMGQCDFLCHYHGAVLIPGKFDSLQWSRDMLNRVILGQCEPQRKLWLPQTPGVCHNGPGGRFLSNLFGVGNVVSDFIILILPLPVLWQIQMPLKQKLQCVFVFWIGFFTCIASIARLVFSFQLASQTDPRSFQLNVDRQGLLAWVIMHILWTVTPFAWCFADWQK